MLGSVLCQHTDDIHLQPKVILSRPPWRSGVALPTEWVPSQNQLYLTGQTG